MNINMEKTKIMTLGEEESVEMDCTEHQIRTSEELQLKITENNKPK